MRQYTPKRAVHNLAAHNVRMEYRAGYPRCQYPCCTHLGQDLHEIASGPARSKAMTVQAALLHLCREHHRIVQGMNVVAQLGCKKLSRSGYDRVTVNRLRGRADESVSETEVNQWIISGRLS